MSEKAVRVHPHGLPARHATHPSPRRSLRLVRRGGPRAPRSRRWLQGWIATVRTGFSAFFDDRRQAGRSGQPATPRQHRRSSARHRRQAQVYLFHSVASDAGALGRREAHRQLRGRTIRGRHSGRHDGGVGRLLRREQRRAARGRQSPAPGGISRDFGGSLGRPDDDGFVTLVTQKLRVKEKPTPVKEKS